VPALPARLHPGDLVLVHVVNPNEKFWGVLVELDVAGVTLHGISVSSFDEWVSQAARRETAALGLSTMFVPLFRVERVFRDETIGQVESYAIRFERRVGVAVKDFLGLGVGEGEEVPS
jgi:hypothetical protein